MKKKTDIFWPQVTGRASVEWTGDPGISIFSGHAFLKDFLGDKICVRFQHAIQHRYLVHDDNPHEFLMQSMRLKSLSH